jgi:uncharacterized protein (TIGR02599 family)
MKLRWHFFGRNGAFTLIEVMVAMAVLGLMMVFLLSAMSMTRDVTAQAASKVSAFQSARAAFDLLTRNLSQATLNSYWDYDDPLNPGRYLRRSELHFTIGPAGTSPFPGTSGTGQAVCFQLPAGTSQNNDYGRLTELLSACGYFISYGPEQPLPAPFPQSSDTFRYRLMQSIEPAEDLAVYASQAGNDWVAGLADHSVPIAENIIYLVAWPRLPPAEDIHGDRLTTGFDYDSRNNALDDPQPETAHQLPPVVQITLFALDETSAARVCTEASPPAEISGAFEGLFTSSDQTTFDDDLDTVESRLASAGLNFRVFTALVPMRESKMQ